MLSDSLDRIRCNAAALAKRRGVPVLTMLLLMIATFFLLRGPSSLVQMAAMPSSDAFAARQSFKEDKHRVALVMPCTFLEAVTSMPSAMDSVLKSSDPYEETIIVFGIRHDLETALNEIFPKDLTPETGKARDVLRNFVLTWTKPTAEHNRILAESRELNMLQPKASMTPLEFLEAFHMRQFLDDPPDHELNEDEKMKYRYFNNLFRLYKDMPSLQNMAERIPKFQIILNQDDYAYPNSNRQKGAFAAFGDTTEIRRNDIISFVDCDDMVSPPRRHVIEQAFKENPEIVEFAAGARPMDISNEWELVFPHVNEQDAKNMEIIGVLPGGDTPELREKMYQKCFDFRDEKLKKQYHDSHSGRNFLIDTQGNYIEDPWNIKKHYLSDNVNFTWWLGSTGYSRATDQDFGYMVHNGHTSWRQEWLMNKILHLPNSIKGEDARLTYFSTQLGGKFLATECPLTVYVMPTGDTKRAGLEMLTKWNRKKFVDQNNSAQT